MTQQQPSNHIPEAKKMVPGDELHLTLLMAPCSLHLVTGQDRQHLLAFGRAAFEAGQAAAQQAVQGMEAEIQQAVEAERERICAAIKAEDDHCVDQGDYMLDSNDCIKIVRGKWVRPDYSVDAVQAKQGEQA